MARVLIRAASDEPNEISRLFDFAEDLWVEFRNNNRVDLNPNKIDANENGIVLEVRDSYLKKALKTVEQISLARYPDKNAIILVR